MKTQYAYRFVFRERLFAVLILIFAFATAYSQVQKNCIVAKSENKNDQKMTISKQKNVLGTDLQKASESPKTGFYRDGFCNTGPADSGTHTVAAVMTDAFLKFSKSRGNDLISPYPASNFPGLKAGDIWCLCANRWKEAFDAGVAPPVILDATNVKTLEFVPFADLLQHKK